MTVESGPLLTRVAFLNRHQVIDNLGGVERFRILDGCSQLGLQGGVVLIPCHFFSGCCLFGGLFTTYNADCHSGNNETHDLFHRTFFLVIISS